jgi:23S rRNA U2552 (ribose-2'-O)-methylase RlmE/FtsJ
MSSKLTKESYLSVLNLIDKVPTSAWYHYRDLMNDHEFDRSHCPLGRGTNRAYFKIWEILSKFESQLLLDTKSLRTCHLAEAPGSFVLALHDYLAKERPDTQVSSYAISKRPNKPSINGGHDGHPTFHRSLFNKSNVEVEYIDLLDSNETVAVLEKVHGSFDFITGDGGIDEGKSFNLKEELHKDLLLAEVNMTINLQKVGGSCMIKFFETFDEDTLKIMYLLVRHYKIYRVCKPKTSRPTNSERYLLCHNFVGNNSTIRTFRRSQLHDVPETVKARLTAANDFICKQQCGAITKVIRCIRGNVNVNANERQLCKDKAFESWCREFKFKST